MQQIRIIELPRMKVVKSGPIRTEQAFNAFNKWFSDYHASLPCQLSPRDFMWFNEREQATEWIYALPTGAGETDCGGYAVEEFPFGLYAVAVCKDADLDEAADWMKTQQEIKDWVESSELFTLHVNAEGTEERYPMFHIVTPGWLQEKGFSLEDMYAPIHMKE